MTGLMCVERNGQKPHMESSDSPADGPALSPDDAFSVLGNETRMNILQTLAQADEPLSWSAIKAAVDVRDGGNFTYHLEKLEHHFVHETEDGYALRQAGRRVVEAVLSGAITDPASLEPARIDEPCPYCGEPFEVSYREERALFRCTECEGTLGGREATTEAFGTLPRGTIELGYLPTAGLTDRNRSEVVMASLVWGGAEGLAVGYGVCPRCAAKLDHAVSVCDDHADDGVCDRCNMRYGVTITSRCPTCFHERTNAMVGHLYSKPAFRAFFDSRGIDVFASDPDDWRAFIEYEEDVVQREPFEGRFTFTLGGETLTLTVDETLSVTDVTSSGQPR